jgi:hypothetical protein
MTSHEQGGRETVPPDTSEQSISINKSQTGETE